MKYYSKQREEILEIVKQSYHHPTAEEIYHQARKWDKTISKSTVYRNLTLLVEEKRLLKITIEQGADRYDYVERKHSHAICKICGTVFDFENSMSIGKIIEEVKKQTGLQAEEEEVVVRGICNKCLLKKEK